MHSFREKVPSSGDFPVGYITKRGNSKRWIEQGADLNSMYRQFESGDTITFFCDGKSEKSENKRKRKSATEDSALVIMNSKSRKSHLSWLIYMLRSITTTSLDFGHK